MPNVVQLTIPVASSLHVMLMSVRKCLLFSYYDGDQERLFSEAHVVSPFRTIPESARAAQVVVILLINLYHNNVAAGSETCLFLFMSQTKHYVTVPCIIKTNQNNIYLELCECDVSDSTHMFSFKFCATYTHS